MDEITAKRQKKGKHEDDKPGEEKTILHGKCCIQQSIFLICFKHLIIQDNAGYCGLFTVPAYHAEEIDSLNGSLVPEPRGSKREKA